LVLGGSSSDPQVWGHTPAPAIALGHSAEALSISLDVGPSLGCEFMCQFARHNTAAPPPPPGIDECGLWCRFLLQESSIAWLRAIRAPRSPVGSASCLIERIGVQRLGMALASPPSLRGCGAHHVGYRRPCAVSRPIPRGLQCLRRVQGARVSSDCKRGRSSFGPHSSPPPAAPSSRLPMKKLCPTAQKKRPAVREAVDVSPAVPKPRAAKIFETPIGQVV